MATILAKRSGAEIPTTTDDDHHEVLANDPAITSIPQGTTYDSFNTNNLSSSGASTFGAPSTGGFGAPGAFGSSTTAVTNSFGSAGSVPATTGAIQMAQQNQSELLKSSGGAMSEGGESTVTVDKDATDWINKKMRPMMGWIYMLTCTCDFVIFPVLWSVLQALNHGQVTSQWNPLTLQGAGLYHIAMGAVLGIAAYGRTKEKVAGVA
jgi:hypothetical protein